jgi:dCTP deaminase
MAVLSRKKIDERLNMLISDPESLVITPLLDKASFDEDSVDLRLGTHFLLPQIPPQPFMDLGTQDQTSETYLQIHTPLGNYFVLPAHQTVLGSTLEFIKLPYNVSGEILTKSSVARTFMVIETAPWIHPSYRGCLTLEIANVSNTAIILYPGMPIGQLVLLETQVNSPPQKLSGSYLGPIIPEAPKLRTPKETLEKIGLKKYRKPGHGWISEANMQHQIIEETRTMSSLEKEKVRAILQIIRSNGVLPVGINPENYF